MTRGYGSLVKAVDTAGDVAKAAKRLDTVADTLDNLNDAVVRWTRFQISIIH